VFKTSKRNETKAHHTSIDEYCVQNRECFLQAVIAAKKIRSFDLFIDVEAPLGK
jgi:hypothetical protein